MHRLAIFVLVLTSSFAWAAPVWVTPKHRAAPPEEMLPGGPLAPVAPEQVPHWSRGAMLRIDLNADGTWQGTLPIDAAGDLRIVPISVPGNALSVTLRDEAGRQIWLSPETRDAEAETTEIPGVGAFSGYLVEIPEAGAWEVSVAAPAGTRSAYLAFATDGAAGLRSVRVTDRTVVGVPITFRASVHPDQDAIPVHGVAMTMIVTNPDGDRLVVPMRADGGGVLAASFTPQSSGRHIVQIVARGDGVLRTAQHVVSVVPDDLAIGEAAYGVLREASDTVRVSISVRDRGRTEHCRVTAQLWGRDQQGGAVPVCWIGGMAVAQVDREGQTVLPLDVDARWIDHAKAIGPYELRCVEVRCPRTLALLCGNKALPLALDFPLGRSSVSAEISPAMRVAPRSDELSFPVEVDVPADSRVAGGHNLLLVHGYCADGNPWPLSDYTGALEIFSDPNSSRSHDEFALLIKAIADTTKSSGVVAHSQGGSAALHLYTYYFSALDWAEGPRLIQSLGTPYQGTPLAGNLAVLGDIFGTGCGENADLSVDGSAIWLAGIPSEARSRVHYWTTSSKGAWCNFFSGLFLTNPEDGVIEVARGQLPGAHSMGNTVGQCHTTGMSDPAQYHDSTRNSEMNANAAR